ncbi:uncharacterized protein LOC128861257 [Anastrepha ludens]|uniref:uncharacterized protein LOC128861257 n=1 Tax=Anastrepha ludens TaxID=28586 RepID=UPI0023B0C946|nr:uncharacterized protein LOC128861257 [Anastrepha ludens]XP_053955222.1 uncharacterized protein LOC128861257 [Anastrepha ludens]XP_053955223.1 uncharacterized protein LOC128861257 [Anastrepha ludens]
MGKKKKSNRRGRLRPHYRGKPLWELLDNLPDHGVGRLIVRGSCKQMEDYPSYMRILNVDMSSKGPHRKKQNKIKIAVEVQRIWRGVIFPRSVNICSTSHLHDFKLVPKDEEEKYLKHTKTAGEVGYHYWTAGQKKRIKALIAQGLTPYEAKQKELERIALEQAEAAERAGVEPSKEPVPKIDPSNFADNFDDVEDEGETEGSVDSDDIPEEKKKNKGQNMNDFSEEFINQRNFENFSPEQKLRIEKMIQNGMDADTAKQLEWERQVAFEAAASNGCNESNAGPSTGSKRSSSLTTNAPSAKLTKIG